MNPIPGVASTYVVATGLQTITSSNAALVGVLFCGTATGSLQIFHGVTASSSATPVIRAYVTTAATAQAAVYYDLNGLVSGGMTISMGASLDPRLLLYWVPIPAGV